MNPGYILLFESGELSRRADALYEILKKCTLCPHQCRVDRTKGQGGKCRSGILPIVSSYSPHFCEESCLVGRGGSGTIFFANCNLACIYCQNYEISHLSAGKEVTCEELADIMLLLQTQGCHNINCVSPSHMVYPIVRALESAIPRGLKLPLVYNSGGYDAVETIELLSDIFDIYMPDMKYMDSHVSGELSGAPDYPAIAMAALREMYRQAGDLRFDNTGIAVRGLLVRHLVLPNNMAGTDRVLAFLAALSPDTYVNIMDQYHPEFNAKQCFDLRRRITLDEFDEAVGWAQKHGLTRIDKVWQPRRK
ncbi:MAG: radical SAM protein [Spirochaetae bacterium HGW-Spirochaetae-1]|nr:MAG: radical SAM protein [Spirochaetae bacterium HGW-Spirochaetae-1]